MFEWHPHILNEKVSSDMKPVQFMKISVNNGNELKEVFDPLAFSNGEKEILNALNNPGVDPLVSKPNYDSKNTLVNFEILIDKNNIMKSPTLDTDSYEDFEGQVKKICKHVFDVADGWESQDFVSMAVTERTERRKLYSFERLHPNIFHNETNKDSTPIPNGVFKGTYGGHGNEIIAVKHNSENNCLEGLKLTGDENVPMGKISFYADLSKPIYLSKEAQRNSSCSDLIQSIVHQTYDIIDDDRRKSQPFVLPRNTMTDDEGNVFDQCICLYSLERIKLL